MKTIEQDIVGDLELDILENCIWVDYDQDSIIIDKQGAVELIKVLQEWVNEQKAKEA